MSAKTLQVLVNGARGSRRRGVSGCKGCGQKMLWVATPAGKAIPFDEVPEVISLDGDVETVSTTHVHWATCPVASRFKR